MVLVQDKKHSEPVKVYCTSCWVDRVITTNGKCKVCGSKLLRPKHWDTTTKKIELIVKSMNGFIPLEIKSRLYLVPIPYIERFSDIDRNDLVQIGQFIEGIKEQCTSFKV